MAPASSCPADIQDWLCCSRCGMQKEGTALRNGGGSFAGNNLDVIWDEDTKQNYDERTFNVILMIW